jgi:hypothetical protein
LKTKLSLINGAGMPISKVIDEQADIYAFLFRVLNMSSVNAGKP